MDCGSGGDGWWQPWRWMVAAHEWKWMVRAVGMDESRMREIRGDRGNGFRGCTKEDGEEMTTTGAAIEGADECVLRGSGEREAERDI